MKYSSVSDLIAKVDSDFIDVVKTYRLACIRNEFYGEDFKDSEVNIFIKDRYPYLMDIIDEYCEIKDTPYSCKYAGALEKIKDFLNNKVSILKMSVGQRARQVVESERKELLSISFFLTELINKLEFEIDIIVKCLNPFSDYVQDLDDNGMTINEDPDYLLFYLNKCVILSHTSFFRDDCVNGLLNLNKRVLSYKEDRSNKCVIGRNAYTSEMLFRLGTLDFNFHFYDEAKAILRKVIEQLESEIQEPDNEKKYMLFSSYLMYVTSYEFTGDYITALGILFGVKPGDEAKSTICDSIIKTFKDALGKKNKQLEDLVFSTASESEKGTVINILNEIFEKNIFQGRMAQFAYENGFVFRELIEKGNAAFEKDLRSVCEEFHKLDGADFKKSYFIPTEIDETRVRDHFIQCVEKNKPMHDYLHILSHCLNEQATAILANDRIGYNGQACELMIIARSLMLYVSENHDYYENASLYKTCYATIFAEAGDFSIANESLKDFQKREYSKLGMDSKAEINFYYYLISRIDSINNGRATYVDDENDESYIHFLNCCYRNFDFDAIAHMSLLSIEYYIATILQQNSLDDLKRTVREDDFFTEKVKNKIKGIGKSGHNIWLSNERRKVNYMYQFLRLFLCTVDQKYVRSPQIYEIASKYLYYSNINTIVESDRNSYIDYTDEDHLLASIKSIFDSYSFNENKKLEHYYILSVGNCAYISLKKYDEKSYQKLGEEINSNQGLFFVHAELEKNQEIRESLSHICNGEEMRLRFFEDTIGALREFFLFCVFERIKNDFVSPNGLFVMTPVHNAEPCKYQITDFGNLITEVYEKIGCSQFEQDEVDLQAQYEPSGISRRALSQKWIRRLQPYEKYIIWAVTLMKRKNCFESRYTYSYVLPDRDIKTAVLLNPEQCYTLLETKIWKRRNCSHRSCNSDTDRCRNNLFDINSAGINGRYFKSLFLSMPELKWKETKERNPRGSLIIWKHESGPYTIWRIVAVTIDKKSLERDNNFKNLPIKLCNGGNDEPFQTTQNKLNVDKWPIPFNVNNNESFVFISHLATASEITKTELNECLEKNNVRYWYDQELIVTEVWKEKIKRVIARPNCVGAILLITDGMFFKSESIGFELNEFVKKKNNSEDFMVIPVVYNCNSEKDFEEKFQTGNGSTYNREGVRTLLGIGNNDRKKIFLNTWNGETLSKYLERERIFEGKRDGALIHPLKEKKVIAF